jgi:predicted RNA-binding Zn-ribbon protein involved in translation (DUF1610 family)
MKTLVCRRALASLFLGSLVLLATADAARAQFGPGGPGRPSPGGGYHPGPSYNPGAPRIPQPGVPRINQGYPNTQPGYRPPGIPQVPVYSPPSVPQYRTEYVNVKQCTNCNREVSDSSGVGQKCPHCGILWTSDQTTGARINNPWSSSSSSSGSSSTTSGSSFRGLRILIGGIVALICGGVSWLNKSSTRPASMGGPSADGNSPVIGLPGSGATEQAANDDAAADFFKNLDQQQGR